MLVIEGPEDLTSSATQELFVSWYGPVFADREAFDRDSTSQFSDEQVLAALLDAASVVAWPAGDPATGEFVVAEPGGGVISDHVAPRLRWVPADGDVQGWQALVVDYRRLPASFQIRGTPPNAVEGRVMRRFNRSSAPVVVAAVVRGVTPEDAEIIEGGVNVYPDGHMVAISFSEPVLSPGAYDSISVYDWAGCVAYRYVPTSETTQTVSFQCPRRGDVGTTDRSAVRVEVRGRVTTPTGATVQTAYRLDSPDAAVVADLSPDPADLTVWRASSTSLARLAGLESR